MEQADRMDGSGNCSARGNAEIDRFFTYHAPKGDQPERYEKIRAAARTFAYVLEENMPSGPDKTVAIRKVREAVMTANAGIACGE